MEPSAPLKTTADSQAVAPLGEGICKSGGWTASLLIDEVSEQVMSLYLLKPLRAAWAWAGTVEQIVEWELLEAWVLGQAMSAIADWQPLLVVQAKIAEQKLHQPNDW